MENYKKLAKNSLLMFIGNMGSKFIVFFMLPFYTHMLSKDQYGDIDLMNTLISFLIPLLTFQSIEAIFRLPKDRAPEKQSEYFSTAIIFSSIFVTLFFVLSFLFIKNEFLQKYFLYFVLILASSHILGIFKEFSRSLGQIRLYAISGVLNTIIFTVLNILMITKYGMSGYFNSCWMSSTAIALLILWKGRLYRYFNIRSIKMDVFKEILVFALPLVPNAIMWWVMNLSDRMFLKYYMGSGELGLYAVANKFPVIITALFGVFFKSWQISAIEEYKKPEYSKFYNNLFEMIYLFLLGIAVAITLVIYPVMKILVAKEYFTSWTYIPILVLSGVFSSYASFVGVNYIAFKETKGAFKTAFISAVINIVLNFILIKRMGTAGAAIATLLSFMAMFFIRTADTRRFVKLKLNLKQNFIEIVSFFGVYFMIYLDLHWSVRVGGITGFLWILIYLNKGNLLKVFNFALKRLRRI